MKPYFEEDGVTIYHADCRDALPLLEPGTVDLVFADPFYVPPSMFDWQLFYKFYWEFNENWLISLKRLVKLDGHCFT